MTSACTLTRTLSLMLMAAMASADIASPGSNGSTSSSGGGQGGAGSSGGSHPYYPKSLQLPQFVPSAWSIPELFGVFGAAVLLVAGTTTLISGTVRPKLSATDRALMAWWAVTGTIHFVLEGAFAASPSFLSSDSKAFLMDAWKEYAISDSRYATRDSFIVAVEGFTAFVEGPLCFLIVYAIATRKHYSHFLQLAVAFGQTYGDILYFLTAYLDGFPHSDPHPLYFWCYFVGMNSIWLVVPSIIAVRSATWLLRASATASTTTTATAKKLQ